MSTSSDAYPASVIAILSAAGLPYPTPDPSLNATTSAASTLTTIPTIIDRTSTTITLIGAAETAASQGGHGGLDTSAAVGIGVGATLAVVVVILSVLSVLWWKRRKRETKFEGPSLEDVHRSDRNSDSEANVKVVWAKAEKDGAGRYEAPDTSAKLFESGGTGRAELVGKWSAAELDGGWRPTEVDDTSRKS